MFVLEKLEVSAGLHTQDSTQVSDATPIEATFHALPGELILGRPLKKGAPGKSDILCANDSSISKEHAVLQLGSAPGPGRAPTAVLKDISRFGTFVRGQKLDNGASVSLQNGDVFKLGHKTCFRLRLKPIHLLARKDLQPDVKERASTLGAHVCTDWSPQVTHVIQETGSELVPATVAASLTHVPVVTSAWLAAMTSRKVFPASELPNPAAYQPEEVLLLQPSRTAVPFSAVQALRSEMRLLQGLHFAFLGGFEDAGLRACISLLGGVVDEVPRPGSLVVTSDACQVPTGALPQTTSAITAAELLACILSKDRGALNRRLAPLPVTQPPDQVLVPPGQQQQDAEDLDITEPGSEEVEDPASVQGGAAATHAGTHRAASPGSRAKQDSSKTAAKSEYIHRGRGGGGKGGASRMPVLLPPTPGGPKPQASVADATSPAGAGSRRGSVSAVGPETAFSEAAGAKASPVGVGAAAAAAADAPAARGPKAGAAPPSTGPLSAAPAVTAKRKRVAEQEEKEEVEEEQAGAGATEDGRAGTEGEVQDGVQAAPAIVHTTKRTRKTKAQLPDTTPEGEEEGGDTHLDSVFGEAPAAKPLNIADMLSPREPPPPAKEQQAKPDPTKRTRTQQEPAGLAQAGGHTTRGPQQRQQLQQKRAYKAAAQAEADKAFERPSGNGTQRGAVGTQQDQREKGGAGSEEGVSHVPPTCVRAPLIVKSVDWEGGAHEALEGMDAGEGAPIQGPNFKRFRKAGANVCLPDHAMPRPKFSLIRVDAFQATDASNAFLKGEQARRVALKRAEELFVANPKPKKHVRGKL